MVTRDLTIKLASATALEVVTALVSFSATESARGIKLIMSQRLRAVLRESAYVDVDSLEREGRIEAVEADYQTTSIEHDDAVCTIDPALPVLSQLRLAMECLESPPTKDSILSRVSKWHRQRQRIVTSAKTTAAVLVGTGPSVNSVDLSQYQRCLTIACNKIHLLPYGFEPRHLVFEDRVVTQDIFGQRRTFGRSYIWLPFDLMYLSPAEAIGYPLDRHVHSFPSFSTVPTVAYSGWTVMFIMLQLAFWMGVRVVYLIGVDGYTGQPQSTCDRGVYTSTGEDDQHFHPSYYGLGQRFQPHQPEKVISAYRLADQVYRDAGRTIVNCSVGTKIDVFVKGTLPRPEALL